MKYVKKLPSTDYKLSAQLVEKGWKKVKEPQNLALSIFFSFPFAFLLGGIVLWIAYFLDGSLFGFLFSDSLKISFHINLFSLLYVLIIWGYMLIHEMIHAIFVPNFLKSEKTFIGLNGMFGFVSTTEPIKKGRFLIITVMPFILLSILPLFVLNFFDYLNWYTLGLCLMNATGSCVDFLTMFLIAIQVKNKRTIISNGFETYASPTK